MKKIILASGSPRRKQLLEEAQVSFEVLAANINESYPQNLLPDDVAVFISNNKAVAVQKMLAEEAENHIIIAADTLVVFNGKIIGKPINHENAFNILTSLSGNVHEVVTGVCILSATKKISFAEKTKVSFGRLSASQINYYISRYKPYDKAGAYAIQEWIGLVGIKSIHGDFYNVMGLPVRRVLQELKKIS